MPRLPAPLPKTRHTHAGLKASLPAPKRARADIARLLQATCSFVERAHGQRIVGLVAEFVPGPGDGLALMAVHGVQLDTKESRGRLGTFTERWSDYLSGMAPAPAPQPPPPSRRNNSPGMLRSGADGGPATPLAMTNRTGAGSGGGAAGLLLRTTGLLASTPGSSTPTSPSGGGGGGGGLAWSGALSSSGSPRAFGRNGSTGSNFAATYGYAGTPGHTPPTRIFSAASTPSAQDHHARPGSAPASVLKAAATARALSASSMHHPQGAGAGVGGSSAYNGHYTARNAASAARAGGGGNPTASPPGTDSYSLWVAREGGPQVRLQGGAGRVYARPFCLGGQGTGKQARRGLKERDSAMTMTMGGGGGSGWHA